MKVKNLERHIANQGNFFVTMIQKLFYQETYQLLLLGKLPIFEQLYHNKTLMENGYLG